MDFLGIGPVEIALVALIAFIVLGPERIPGVMRQLGKWIRQMREMTNNITRDYGSDIQQLTGEITAIQSEIRSLQQDIGQMATGFMTTTSPAQPPQSTKPDASPALPPNSSGPTSTVPPAGSMPDQAGDSFDISI